MSERRSDTVAEASAWLERARLDVHDARAVHDSSPSSYENVVYFTHQAVHGVVGAFPVVCGAPSPAEPPIDFAESLLYPHAGERLNRETGARALELMDRPWALFEPRIAEVREARAAEEDADEAEADEPDADPHA